MKRALAFALVVALALACTGAAAGVFGAPNDATDHGVFVDGSRLMAPVKGATDLRVRAAVLTTAPSGDGAFRTSCPTSHMAWDDPIVHPGAPGTSHLHVFFGNDSADARTTAANIRTRGGSTCPGGSANRTAYWVPAVVVDGAPRVPIANEVYYKTGFELSAAARAAIQPMPAGLRMIAGSMSNDRDVRDPAAGGAPWVFSPYTWKCMDMSPGFGYAVAEGQQIPRCPPANDGAPAHMQVWAIVAFPQCWDGANLDSPDHKSHMHYPVDGACPATHPVAFPVITFNIIYAVAPGEDTSAWRLSSDMYGADVPGGRSLHADWFNGWNQDVLRTWIVNCIRASRDCHNDLLGDGTTLY